MKNKKFVSQVPPPDLRLPDNGKSLFNAFINGWAINAHSVSLEKAWSKYGSHGYGWIPDTPAGGSRDSKDLYSTKELAAIALRIAVKERFEQEYDQAMKRIDSHLK